MFPKTEYDVFVPFTIEDEIHFGTIEQQRELLELVHKRLSSEYSSLGMSMTFGIISGIKSTQSLKEDGVICESNLKLCDENEEAVYRTFQNSYENIAGALVNAKLYLAPDKEEGLSSYLKSLSKRLEESKDISDALQDDAFGMVGHALLFGEEIASSQGKYCVVSNISRDPRLSVRIYDPTQQRIAEAGEPFVEFMAFLDGHYKDVILASQFVYGRNLLLNQAKAMGSIHNENASDVIDGLKKAAARLESKANDIVKKLNPPDTGLQKYVPQ